ncbi:MAG: O-antigen ligase family protein [Patescibacteria group bacterium]|nr:O-antigen ligase family protein [Patescibacteria group bacterium]MDD4304857.1 O-antigen ligase family protein [Patescibacteria group bacterium]MDD4695825.1 O-antigen ligase family protein [Patescibacteria group bacterium]
MQSIINKKFVFIFEAVILLSVLAFIVVKQMDFVSSLGIVIVAMILPMLFIMPYYSLLFLIIVRNTTDLYTESIFISIFDIITLNFSSILGIIIIFWSIFIILKERIIIKKIPLFYPWVLFLIFSAISFVYSVDIFSSIKMFSRILSFFLIYIISYFYFVKYKDKKDYFLKALFVSYLLPCAFGVYQLLTGTGSFGQEGFIRVNGTYYHPNSFAFNLLFVFVVFSIIYFNSKFTEKTLKYKNWLKIYLIMISVLLVATLTRSAWIGFVLFIGSLILIYGRKSIAKFALLIIGVLFMFYVSMNYTPLKYYNFNEISVVRRVTTSAYLLSSWEWRNKVWTEMTSYVYQSPIIGFGLDTFGFLREKQINDVYESTYAHNDYLKILIELGFVGIFLYLNLIFHTLKNIFKKFLEHKDNKYLISFIGILIIFLISSVDNILTATSLQWVMWSYIAYILS